MFLLPFSFVIVFALFGVDANLRMFFLYRFYICIAVVEPGGEDWEPIKRFNTATLFACHKKRSGLSMSYVVVFLHVP